MANPAGKWWPTLPERDEYEHSHKSAHRSMMPPCQNREPAKDERKTPRIRPRVGGRRRRHQQPENQPQALVERKQVFEDIGSWASWNHPGLSRLEAAVQPGDCVKVAGLDRLGRPRTEVLELLGRLSPNPPMEDVGSAS